jgi:hypothetical protein
MPVSKRVQVLLPPHRSYLYSDQSQSWPRPAGVNVELVELSSGSEYTTPLGETNDKGVLDLSLGPELESGIYRLRLSDYGFESVEFESADDLPLTIVGRTRELRLAPCGDRWLVLLQLTEEPAAAPVRAATVHITGTDAQTTTGTASQTPGVTSTADGRIYATAPAGDDVTLQFDPVQTSADGRLIPVDASVSYTAPQSNVVSAVCIAYRPTVQIVVESTVTTPDGAQTAALIGSSVTVEYRGCSAEFPALSETRELEQGQQTVVFEYPFPGVYVVSVTPPATVSLTPQTSLSGLPIQNTSAQITKHAFSSGGQLPVSAIFEVTSPNEAVISVTTPQNQPLSSEFTLNIVSSLDNTVRKTLVVKATDTPYTVQVSDEPLVFQIDTGTTPSIKQSTGDIPLELAVPQQPVVPGTNTIPLVYEHSITGQVVDEHGRALPGATIEIRDDTQAPYPVIVADEQGSFEVGLPAGGKYYLSQYPEAGQVGRREPVMVNSPAKHVLLRANAASPGAGAGATGREALTDLAAYPVLTEEISTTGPPAPATGAPAAGGPGAGYGQTVEQVMRDVLGWRPSGDVAGFQAALTGAFQLRQVEGHTEWSWQQRGYAVQADMGALTGAQASIYARAKSALDQMLPLLAGLTTLNPALYPPQDLEAIRTVITAELQELVNELALEGGPRIRRVDELLRMLTGESRKSRNPNPDAVQGQLGIMRDRFGLTVANVDTVDEERIVTNFRVVVEQVLTLQESWESDRKLLSVLDSNTSLGTILIWLSRGLEAACESVDDLTFALDSVFVDAAQRQVIQLNFSGLTVEHLPELPLWKGKTVPYSFPGKQAPILLSDLLDWVVRASRDEGPKIVQDAGKDGVLAFAPILNELRILIHATRQLTHSAQGATLPDGMRTPRVRRAVEVLAAQLDEAANLAALVKRDGPPEITGVSPDPIPWNSKAQATTITLTGTNFRRHCSVFLFAANREDVADIPSRGAPSVTGQSSAKATFKIPFLRDAAGRLDWQVVLTNEDGSSTEPVALTFHKS